MLKGFDDAVITQDAAGLGKAADDGAVAVQDLKAVSAIPGLAPERAAEAGRLSSAVQQLLDDARNTYGAVLANPESMVTERDKLHSIAGRTTKSRPHWRKQRPSFPPTWIRN